MTSLAIGYTQNLPVDHRDVFEARQVEEPRLRPHDLLVEVMAVSVNPVDHKLRQGAAADGFRVLGFDAAGVVRRLGSAVELFAVGDHVYYAGDVSRPGTNQQLHAVDERVVGRKPHHLDYADAAALPLTAITAWESLFDRLALTPHHTGTLLVVGAAGGVGSVLLQLAEALLPGVRVLATASRPETAAWARRLGAEDVVDRSGDLVGQVTALVPGGVDWVFTAHSAGQLETYAALVRPHGSIVAIDDGPRDVEPLKPKSISWHWELMFTRPMFATPDQVEQHRLLNQVAELVDQGAVVSTATTRLGPISVGSLTEAHRLVETNQTIGKVVLAGW